MRNLISIELLKVPFEERDVDKLANQIECLCFSNPITIKFILFHKFG